MSAWQGADPDVIPAIDDTSFTPSFTTLKESPQTPCVILGRRQLCIPPAQPGAPAIAPGTQQGSCPVIRAKCSESPRVRAADMKSSSLSSLPPTKLSFPHQRDSWVASMELGLKI